MLMPKNQLQWLCCRPKTRRAVVQEIAALAEHGVSLCMACYTIEGKRTLSSLRCTVVPDPERREIRWPTSDYAVTGQIKYWKQDVHQALTLSKATASIPLKSGYSSRTIGGGAT